MASPSTLRLVHPELNLAREHRATENRLRRLFRRRARRRHAVAAGWRKEATFRREPVAGWREEAIFRALTRTGA